jgi:hypothetical protein
MGRIPLSSLRVYTARANLTQPLNFYVLLNPVTGTGIFHPSYLSSSELFQYAAEQIGDVLVNSIRCNVAFVHDSYPSTFELREWDLVST